MASLLQYVKYGAINTDDTTTDGLYVIKLLSKSYMLHYNIKTDGQVISAGELVDKAQYLFYMQ